jgi:hypothetical protein
VNISRRRSHCKPSRLRATIAARRQPRYDTVVALADALGTGLETFRALAGRAGDVGRHLQSLLLLRRRVAPPNGPASSSSPTGDMHARMARAKFDIGSPAVAVGGEPGELPATYGRDRAVLLARDPWCIFAYWELTPATRAEAARNAGDDTRLVLRIHDLTGGRVAPDGEPWLDVELGTNAGSEYVNVARPGVVLSAELGLRTGDGRFIPLVRSNALQVPPSQASPDGSLCWLPLRIHGARSAASRPRGPAVDALPAGTPLRSSDVGVRH